MLTGRVEGRGHQAPGPLWLFIFLFFLFLMAYMAHGHVVQPPRHMGFAINKGCNEPNSMQEKIMSEEVVANPEEIVIDIAAFVKARELREDAVVAFFEERPELLKVTLKELQGRKFKKAEVSHWLFELMEAVKKSHASTTEAKPQPQPEVKAKPEVKPEAQPKPEVKAKPEVFPTFTEPVKAYLRERTKVENGEVIITFPEKDGKKVPPQERIWKMLNKKGAKNPLFDYFLRGNTRLVIRKKKH